MPVQVGPVGARRIQLSQFRARSRTDRNEVARPGQDADGAGQKGEGIRRKVKRIIPERRSTSPVIARPSRKCSSRCRRNMGAQ